jgi:hypothetical protein
MKRPFASMSIRSLMVGSLTVASLVMGSLAACGGGSGDPTPPLRVDLIEGALDAVEERSDSPVAYFEVNATPLVVNLFVSTTNDSVVQYVYDGTALVGPSEPLAAEGTTFDRALLDFAPDDVLGKVLGELPDSQPYMFVINGLGTDVVASRVEYRILLRSVKGGELAVVVDRTGGIIGTDAE